MLYVKPYSLVCLDLLPFQTTSGVHQWIRTMQPEN